MLASNEESYQNTLFNQTCVVSENNHNIHVRMFPQNWNTKSSFPKENFCKLVAIPTKSMQGVAKFYSGQARYKHLVAAKEGRYKMVFKSQEARETERKRQLEKLKSLLAVVEKLETDFPASREHLQNVSVSLKSRLSEMQHS